MAESPPVEEVRVELGRQRPSLTRFAAEDPKPIEITDPVEITVDGRTMTVQNGDLLIDAVERHGVYIPRFCYHPRMEPVGMCRMCLVEIEGPRGTALAPACMNRVAADQVVHTQSAAALDAQDGVIEYLLINHPLDCPVCDKGGECPLQDQSIAYGPGESRFVEEKRHYTKPIPISETVYLDRERCILCDRCTRFADQVAGDPLITFTNRGNNTQIATFPETPFASYFSGNTVQICPVGALTAKPYRFKARPWDLEEVESTCTSCSVGCRITAQSSRDALLRFQGVDSDPVNWGWLCDRGRFGFEANANDRIEAPLVRRDGELEQVRWSEAYGAAEVAIANALEDGPDTVAVLGGSRLTNEAAYAWAKLAKGVWGTDHTDAQLGDGLPASIALGLPAATIDDVCRPGGTVLYVGPDPREELPVLYLRLRHAVLADRVKLINLSAAAGSLDELAAVNVRAETGTVGRMVAELLAEGAEASGAASDVEVARALLATDGPLSVVVGRRSPAEGAGPLADAVSAVRQARPEARFLTALRRGNVRGALELGLAPGVLPGRMSLDGGRAWFSEHWHTVPAAPGLGAVDILAAAADGRIRTLVLLGADPIGDAVGAPWAAEALERATTISLATHHSASTLASDVVLPVLAHAEMGGSTTNLEGRVTGLGRRVTGPGTARADWVIAAELSARLGTDLGLTSVAGIQDEMEHAVPTFSGADLRGLDDQGRQDGVLLPLSSEAELAAAGMPERLVFQAPEPTVVPSVSSYSFRLVLKRRLYDPGTMLGAMPSSVSLAPEPAARLNPADFGQLGIADGAMVGVRSPSGEVHAPAHADEAVPRGDLVLEGLLPEALALVPAKLPLTEVRLESTVWVGPAAAAEADQSTLGDVSQAEARAAGVPTPPMGTPRATDRDGSGPSPAGDEAPGGQSDGEA
ncbi:MAG: NADH-quinone oxidoreductase subunit NuoG [Microthrixaceae bacterium]